MQDPVRDYIFGQATKVRGYLGPVDALAMSALLLQQRQDGLKGGVVEIGVHLGRSFFLFAKIIDDSSRLFAIDWFGPEKDKIQLFYQNARKIGVAIDSERVFAGDSAKVTPAMIRDKVGDVAFFHIDGGHEFAQVEQDAELASAVLAEFGVIVFDDFFNPEWPDTTTAVLQFLQRHPEYCAFAITAKKLYVCRVTHRERYAQVARTSDALRKIEKRSANLLEAPIVFLMEPLKRRVQYELASRSGFEVLARRMY